MTLQQYINQVMIPMKQICTIWDWNDCPFEEKWSLGHSGDEDYVVLYLTNEPNMDWKVVNSLTVCDNNQQEYGVYTLAVTAHA